MTSQSPSSSTTPAVDPTPLLPNRQFTQTPSLRGAARFLRRASSRRMLREPSMRVRESAAEQIEERQSDWAYSRPVRGTEGANLVTSGEVSVGGEVREYGDLGPHRLHNNEDDDTSVAKHLESANTMFSFIWWIVGFYWVSSGGQHLTQNAPQLYWLCVTFLAFDVFFVVICVAVACVVGIAVCCCLPCIIAILYAVADQEGATKDDIERLPKYKFNRIDDFEKQNGEIQKGYGGIMVECDTDAPVERALSEEDAECCICLCSYDDGTELRELPCCHHFHVTCIDKWLYINATCPLCKFNILKNGYSIMSRPASVCVCSMHYQFCSMHCNVEACASLLR
nr:E3 ubiquitin-protein ligase At1g63170-like [Tanacetum cinerariifolium]GEX71524.1 E3 ubiquitin-protein ligase At1g63170-like [Tanacetum cinerariifolium]